MGWLNIPSFLISEADQRGDSVYEVLYKDWGLTATSQACVDQWPVLGDQSIPVTLAGLSIGPRSTVDRAWVTYNLQKNAPSGVDNSNIPTLTSRIRPVTVGAPLLFSQAAAPGTKNANAGGAFDELLTMVQRGSLYIWPQSDAPVGTGLSEQTEVYRAQQATTVYSQYITIAGATRSLGLTGIQTSSPALSWVGPLLHLQLYLKAFLPPPIVREPLKAYGAFLAGAGATEQCIGQFAIFGRRTVRLMLQANAQSDFRVAVLRTANGWLGHTGVAIEEPLDSASAVAANTPTVISPCAGSDTYADYLLVYATAAANTTFKYTLSAYD